MTAEEKPNTASSEDLTWLRSSESMVESSSSDDPPHKVPNIEPSGTVNETVDENQKNVIRSVERVDRISALHDDFLRRILFFLPTKYAIRSGVLSTRWKDLWKLVNRLDLNNQDAFPSDDAFSDFVDGFLELGGDSQLYKFKILVDWEADANSWTAWINTLNRRGIQDFNVMNVMDDKFELSPSLLRSNTLVSLRLDRVVVRIPGEVFLPNLKNMDLGDMEFVDELSVNRLISSCVNLENLLMSRNPYDNTRFLCVRSRSLKRFEVVFDRMDEDCSNREYSVVIDTPSLEYLSVKDPVSKSIEIRCLGFQVKAVVDVMFGVDINHGLDSEDFLVIDAIRGFLTSIATVDHLIVSRDTLKVINFFRRLEQPLPEFSFLSLEVTCEWRIFQAFLHKCPNLKRLVLAWKGSPTDEETRFSMIPACLTSLEFLEIKTPIKADTGEMKLITFFLKNSVALKKLTVRLKSSGLKKNRFDITKELGTCPRGSLKCEVQVY